jgi:hypothetical protein
MHQMTMMKPVDHRLETQSDEQPDRDRNQVYEKIPPGMYRLVRWVNVQKKILPECSR